MYAKPKILRNKIFHLIWIVIIFFIVGDHLVILGGANESDILSDVELLGIQTENAGCNPTDLPSPVTGHASVYSPTTQSLISCGGLEGGFTALSNCTAQSKNGNHISMPPMNSNRSVLDMVSIQNQLIAIGGIQHFISRKNTMESIQLNETNGNWIQQYMPFYVYGHCAVTLGNNVIIIGGAKSNCNVS